MYHMSLKMTIKCRNYCQTVDIILTNNGCLAEWGHAHIRKELGYGDLEPDNIRDMLAQRDRGSRYSFGYPACPNVADSVAAVENHGYRADGDDDG